MQGSIPHHDGGMGLKYAKNKARDVFFHSICYNGGMALLQDKSTAISFHHVNKYFFYQHQRTLKEFFHAFVQKKKTLERVHALKDMTYTIKSGESVGIIGRNGAGKSTMLKLIAGVSEASNGTVDIHGKVAPLIELGAGFHPELTGKENVFLNGVILGLKESYIKTKYNDIVHFAEIEDYMDVPVKYYSSGMYTRLAFSVAVHVDPDILLIDEILAVGDTVFQQKCLNKMEEFKAKGITIVFVSHDLASVSRFCTRVLYLKTGSLEYDGDPQEAIRRYSTGL